MKTFTEALKNQWCNTMQSHQNADLFVQGTWLETPDHVFTDGNWAAPVRNELYRGCFFGCAIQQTNNVLEKASSAMQLPMWLIATAETIFEYLPPKEAVLFPVQLLNSIPTRTDITKVFHTLAIRRVEDTRKQLPELEDSPIFDQVIDYHKGTGKSLLETYQAVADCHNPEYDFLDRRTVKFLLFNLQKEDAGVGTRRGLSRHTTEAAIIERDRLLQELSKYG